MLTMKVFYSVLLFGQIIISCHGKNVAPCMGDHLNKADCEAQTMGNNNKVNCEFMPDVIDSETPCVVDVDKMAASYEEEQSFRRSLGENPDKKVADVFTNSIPESVNLDKFQEIAASVNLQSTELGDTKGAGVMRTLSLDPIFGLGGGLFGKPLFPECPVHVKYCYRVPCGGYGNEYLETNPKQCLSDPRCCYDYKLAYMKKIFGPKFMGGSPSCYYGATSKQWVYITSFFKPWNLWYGKYILEAFGSFFNTNAYDIGGKLACQSDFRRKAYPVGSKSELQCNLVSGCWREDLPEGSQCLMASDLIQSLFGRKEVYPSLFTNDPKDTKCSANWYEYGQRAYNRMPCGVGPASLKVTELLTSWCPAKECCLNYAALDKDEKSKLMSYYMVMQSLGSGFSAMGGAPGFGSGFPHMGGMQQQTPFDPRMIFYLLASSSSSSDLSDLFCPYKSYASSVFPDLSEFAEGCCEIPKCYHKKKLVQPAYPYPYPTMPTPPPTPHPQPVHAAWGAWGECKASCGSRGMRYRECYVGTMHRRGLCPGHDSQQCMGKPCAVQYYWGQWAEARPCSRSCGGGYVSYRRVCYGNNKPVQSYRCQGSESKSETCGTVPCQPEYAWSQRFVQLGPCSETCGQGYAVWGRQCVTSSGQVVNAYFCGRDDERQSRTCVEKDCPAVAEWGKWFPVTECGATCGPRGLRLERRYCYANEKRTVTSACEGDSERTERCAAPDCPTEYFWTGYITEPCLADSAGRYCTIETVRERSKRCYEFINGRYVYVSPQSRCGPARKETMPCNPQQCMEENGGYQ